MSYASQQLAHSSNTTTDETYTPTDAILPLLPYLDHSLTYYDCTSNSSMNIVNCLRDNGFKCLGSEGRDFLIDDIPAGVDAIITNPPYSIKDKFIKRCYELDKHFALLMPINTLQGKYRSKLFETNGIELLVFGSRIKFTDAGSPPFGVAWYCKDILPQQLVFHNE